MNDNEMLKAIYDNMQEIKGQLHTLEGDMKEVKGQLHTLDGDMGVVKGQLHTLDGDMGVVKGQLHTLNGDMGEVKGQIKDIQLTLENETNRNIKIIAEGHLDLSRKLDDAVKVDNEKELLLIRVNILENEVRKLKEKIQEIA